MTLLHLLVIFALSGLARRCSRRCSAATSATAGRALLPWPAYLRQVAPTGEGRGRAGRAGAPGTERGAAFAAGRGSG